MKEKLVRDILEEKQSVVNLTHSRLKKNTDACGEELFKDEYLPMPRFKMVIEDTLRVPLIKKQKMTHPQKVLMALRALYRCVSEGEEYIFVITLDRSLTFVNGWIVGHSGEQDEVVINRRKLASRITADDHAAAFIIAHNHISGNVEPSLRDMKNLAMLKTFSWNIDTPMRDFIIFSGDSENYYSYRDEVDKNHNRHLLEGMIDEECGLCTDEVFRGL